MSGLRGVRGGVGSFSVEMWEARELVSEFLLEQQKAMLPLLFFLLSVGVIERRRGRNDDSILLDADR